jgi:fucose 4-O-acetylase-like acetyltransferase
MWSVNTSLIHCIGDNSLEITLLLTEITKIVRNEILHVQSTTQNAVTPV